MGTALGAALACGVTTLVAGYSAVVTTAVSGLSVPPGWLAVGHSCGVDLLVDLDLGGSRLRTLTVADAPLVAEATSGETGRALWGARPVGPYSLVAAQQALAEWDLDREAQTSYGVVKDGRLIGAVGLMLDGPGSVEVAYWVRPENRRRGVAARAVRALTEWAHEQGMSRLWLEINPENVGSQRLAERVGYRLVDRLVDHCRSWVSEDPERDVWHDCLIWTYEPLLR
jgi:RimJ/RimL family protein N-acetyltransferase